MSAEPEFDVRTPAPLEREAPASGGSQGPSLARYRTGALTVALLAVVALRLAPVEFDAESPGLANNTTSVRDSQVAGIPVRDNERPLLEVIGSLPAREGGRQLIVWIGNSHQHAINSIQPGDRLSSVYLHLALNGETYPGRRPAFGLSYPNLRYEEQFLLTLALALADPARRPALIVHGVRFHDARESGVRSTMRPVFTLPRVRAWLEEPPLPTGEYEEALTRLRADRDLAEVERRKEEGLEAWLVGRLGPRLPIFQRRDYLYARFEQGIHVLRDRAFGIDTQTKRPILQARYELSMQFLELALRVARDHDIAVLLYNVPLRGEVENPYIPEQYAAFRGDLAAMASRHGALFRDYDALIPEDLWGSWYTSDFPDFSHFTAAGHRLLAERVRNDIQALLEASGTAAAANGSEERALQ